MVAKGTLVKLYIRFELINFKYIYMKYIMFIIWLWTHQSVNLKKKYLLDNLCKYYIFNIEIFKLIPMKC